ncbi:hypothetical protein [Martelella radicis]|uniref:Uncharacterized protein n=1 Tax=Martelella radicis TaxID=1397476 RepID=A0A7W6PBZ4_9HYPH|nr:hypothetical protein [Martelella radicis]MBB4123971.1 hypothetical protein [Martelella radicis]
MRDREHEIMIDCLIDIMAELGEIEQRVKAVRETLEPIADTLFFSWKES